MIAHTNHRILVIDDNRAIHDDFRKILGPADGAMDQAEAEFFGGPAPAPTQPTFEIDSAFQGKEGVGALRRSVAEGRPYAMAFVDVRMPPGIDGIETAERLWEICPELQVVLCTAYSDYSWQEMILRLGHNDRLLVLKKPFASIEALQLACALCEKWELTKESRDRLAITERIVEERTRELHETNQRLVGEIEQRRLAEMRLLRVQRLESIGTLASGIAHDLNNMLSPILMGASLLVGKQSDDTLEKVAVAIEENAERAAEVVKQVLTFARGLDGDRTPLDAGELIRKVRELIGQTFPKNIQAQVEPGENLPLIDGDARQLQQVLLNLCVNARDAMPDGGTLALHAGHLDVDEAYASMTPEAHPGRYVVLRIRDTGCGIPHDVLEKIFDPFFTTKPIGKGTGLGLSTVAGIVRGHGGFVNVSSHVGQGTVFEVFLPASRENAVLDESPAPAASPRGHGELVLVVDDESAVLEVTTTLLRDHGYRTLSAAGGAEALSIYAGRAPEIKAVLTDVLMPVVDGVALCRALRKIDPLVKLIASTGEEEQTRRGELDALRVQGFLTKPFGNETLLTMLREVLGSGHAIGNPA